ncbi:hypothetical protein EW146_g3235 [Bondarzewia mesenterica]|uniref:Transcription initiation factor TFIID subunit 8 n=1 Tax=Bondarzewia mesenterica TaxID=1095465 RepID=A0A4S4LZM6_9AGAM|nr:hypothetical protein EW146_g3235 [Bondarzewia mesenterica]
MSSYPQSQAYAQAYGSYQASYAHYPSQTHYPSANYAQLPAPSPSYATLFNPPKKSPSPEPVLPPPAQSDVTPQVASKAMQRLMTAEMKNEGFDAAEPAAMKLLELEVVAFIEELHRRAHEYANLANRASPIAKDLLLACDEYGFEPASLQPVEVKWKKQGEESGETESVKPLILVPPSPEPALPELLPSDDEGTAPVIPATLRTIPHLYPALPPKHTYFRTPPSPPKRQALPSLEKKLKNAGLVQESLKNLLLATEDTSGPDDGELLGAIVNWEGSGQPRKRWKLSAQ